MADLLQEFQQLADRRDNAAYRLVGAVETALLFFEAQTYAEAEMSLRRAYAEFQLADLRVTEFHQQHRKEGFHYGQPTA